jgi:hypothetical protein
MREPSAEGVAPSRLGVVPSVGLPSPELDCLAGVSRTNLRNCVLFIVNIEGRSQCSVADGLNVGFEVVSQPRQDISAVRKFTGGGR